MPAPQALLDQLRRLAPDTAPPRRVTLGEEAVDAALSGGLRLGALHEVYAASGGDAGAATGFALALAARAAQGRPILWARQDMLDAETGRIYAPGLTELGIAPGSIVLVRGRDAADVLKAGEDAARCGGLGAALIAPWGSPASLDLTASRRLVLAAGASGVTVTMLRIAAQPAPSAAETRWRIAAAPSQRLDADAPGLPAFDTTLLRQRGGAAGQSWFLEWNRDRQSFVARADRHAAPLSRPVVSLPRHGAAGAAMRRSA